MSQQRDWFVIAATLLLLVPVLLPALVTYLPEIYLQDDPRMMRQVARPTEFGPAGLAWWNVYTVAAAAIAMLIAGWRGVRLSKWATGLSAVIAAACAWHMGGPLSDRLQGGAWIAAAALGLAVFHLGQLPTARRWAAAAMIAMLIPITLEAMFDRFVSLPLTVKTYFENREQVLASRGWEIGSPEALKYEQRLMAPDVTGSYGMSNVLAAVVVASTLMTAALAINMRIWTARLTMIVLAMTGAWVVYATRSKAGLGLLVLGLVLLAVCQFISKRGKGRWLVASLAMGLTALVIGAVMVRGLMGPPQDHTDPSLSVLFRYHYWQGAACAVVEAAPMSLLTGLGSSAFRAAYHHCRNPISPEIIQSTHSVFVDGIAMLGIGGWCAVLLLVGWLIYAARAAVRAVAEEEIAEPAGGYKPDLVAVGMLAAVLFGVQYAMRLPEMAYDSALLWLVGLLGFTAAMTALVHGGRSETGERGLRIGLLAAAAAGLAHGQFDLVFFHLTACGFMWFVLGLAGAGGVVAPGDAAHRLPSGSIGRRVVVPGAMLMAAVLMIAMYAGPITQQQTHVARADTLLRTNHVLAALEELDAASEIVAIDRLPLRWRVRLNLEMAIGFAQLGRQREARAALDRSFIVIDQAVAHGLDMRTAGLMRSQTYEMAATYLGEEEAWAKRADTMEAVIAVDPYSVQPHLDTADAMLKAGRKDRALALYHQTLTLSGRMYLDPTQQLSERDRERVKQRIKELETGR